MQKEAIILVVDDNSVNRAVLFDYLDSRGYHVLIAETGEAGVEIAARMKPNVILMDIMLPGIDGHEACRQIRSNTECKHIPIIFMSALDDNQSKAEGLKAGGSAYVTKPVLYDEIASLLNTYVKLQKLEAATNRTDGRQNALSEFDALIDIIAHDMKSPLVCILGFASELADDFSDKEVPEEWVEYASIIKKSSSEVDTILEALVLLKNLRVRQWKDTACTPIKDILRTVSERYNSLDNLLPLDLNQDIETDAVMSEATLLEELILILWRNFSNLNAEAGDKLPILIESKVNESGMVILSMEANTRKITQQELQHILEPMAGGKRKKVKDTNILTICAQKLIEYLAINAWAEPTEAGLKISLSFSPPTES